MNLTEFIGFLFSFGLFIFLMIKRALSDRYRRQHPEIEIEEQKREEQELRNVFRELGIEEDDEDIPEEIKPLPPPPKPKIFHKPPPPKPLVTHSPTYEIEERSTTTPGDRLLNALPAYKNLLIYYEIFGPPKALRKD